MPLHPPRHEKGKRKYGHGNYPQAAAYLQPPPAGQVLSVKQNGEIFYADPDTIRNQVYTGYRVQYQAYKQAQLLASRQNPALNVHPDPHGVVVNEFDGRVPGPLDPVDGH